MSKSKKSQVDHLHMRVSPEWLERLDAWREAQDVPPSRSDVVRIAVERFIGARGQADVVLTDIREACE